MQLHERNASLDMKTENQVLYTNPEYEVCSWPLLLTRISFLQG